MKQGFANHFGLKSCADLREGVGEALTEVLAGRFSLECLKPEMLANGHRFPEPKQEVLASDP